MSPEYDSVTLIGGITPDLQGMMEAVPKSMNIEGVGLTIQNNRHENQAPLFFSRFFAPWIGINEDEVCGSMHAVLTPYWGNILGKQSEVMMTRFVSSRTGDIYVKLERDKVLISGKTVVTLEGSFSCADLCNQSTEHNALRRLYPGKS
jgi:predicted PhzF superfamily epimerase YddE/YHI9